MASNRIPYAGGLRWLVSCATLGFVACSSPSRLNIPPSPVGTPAQVDMMKDAAQDDTKLLHIAEVSSQAGDFSAAIQLYRKVTTDRPTDLQARLGLADALVNTGALKDATVEYRAASALATSDSRPYIGLCRIALVEHRPADALAEADRALGAGANRANVYDAKGIALDMLGRHAEAQATYQIGMKTAPDDMDLKNNYALSLAISGSYEQAINILTQMVQQPDATERNRQNLALALGLEGNVAAAKMIASRDLSPTDVENNLKYYSLVRSGTPAALR